MREPARPAVAALSFLTAAPVGRRASVGAQELRRGVVLFPVVGALLGAVTGLVAWSAALLLPAFPAGVLGVAAGILATGALHLDGLADTADGVGAVLGGDDDPAAAMADPRLGAWGGAALVLDLLLKTAVLAVLVEPGTFPWETVAAGCVARMSIVALAWAVPYAGPDRGTGAWTRGIGRTRCLAGLGIGAAICVLAAGARSLPMAIAAGIVCAVVGRWSARHTAGMRGDTFGAAAELTETFALTVALV